ncbi:hypothetical protein F0562_011335 [Nyssa sinensis]|uniref:Uncharacterized protein n=1 Tax=Nyssa sinensis TaxID=561372 RepID=A0A5J5A6Q6_9ASTE|nr:hypothetical protein F0562_011335 [Nyssa sinensis]
MSMEILHNFTSTRPKSIVCISYITNAHGKHVLHLPFGYYGNAFAFPTTLSKEIMLSITPLGYALELVKKAKGQVIEDYIKLVADLMVIKGRPLYRRRITSSAIDLPQGEHCV